jgi:hypothetical protein
MSVCRISTRCVGLLAMALLAWVARPAAADIAVPDKHPAPTPHPVTPIPKSTAGETGPAAPFVVRRDATQDNSRIIIPRKLLPAGNAVPVTPAAPAAASSTGTEEDGSAANEHRTINMGIMLAVVITSGGLAVAFVRRRKTQVGALLLIGLVASSLLIGTAMADIPSPFGGGRPVRPRPAPPAPPTAKVETTIVVETVDSGDQIVLILGKNSPDLPK